MKILFITHDMDSGGAARSLLVLVQRIAELGHNIEIVSLVEPRKDRSPWLTYESLNIPVHVAPYPWIPLAYVGCRYYPKKYDMHYRMVFSKTVELMKGFRPDTVCFNGYPSTSLAPHITAKRKVLIAREVFTADSPLFKSAVGHLRRNIDFAIAIGPVEAKQLDEIGIQNEIIFNTANERPAFSDFGTFPPINFGCFGNMLEVKGQANLIVASVAIRDHLRKSNAFVHIYGAGDSSYMQNLSDFIRQQDVEDIVRLEGWTNNVEQAMRDMHCIIRPDLTGSPWGRDVIEAMSMGRPMLATGSVDVFVKPERTGWLVPPDDPTALANQMLFLLRSPQLLPLAGRAAFAFAAENFDPLLNAKKIIQILNG